MAALVAHKFKIDPILVLKSTFKEWAIRIAAYRYILEREEEADRRQQEKQRAQQARRGGTRYN